MSEEEPARPEGPKVCFVAMPVTTAEDAVEDYRGDVDHFLHVLDHLFAPAVESAGYKLQKPIMTGADLIQAEVIRRLEQADLVLFDLSRHNPNVFFELGVRTALDRPVSLVRDEFTPKLPFDTSMINTHTYDSTLNPWNLEAEVARLADHIGRSAAGSGGSNPMWKYFGLTQRASPDSVSGDPVEAKLDYILGALRASQLAESRPWSQYVGHVDDLVRKGASLRPAGLAEVVLDESLAVPILGTDEGFMPPGLDEGTRVLIVMIADIVWARAAERLWMMPSKKKNSLVFASRRPLPPDVRKVIERMAGREGLDLEVTVAT